MRFILGIERSEFVCSNTIYVTDTCVNYIWSYKHVMLQGVSFTNRIICFAVVIDFSFSLNNTFPLNCFTYPGLWSQGNLQAIHLLLYKLQYRRLYLHSHMCAYVCRRGIFISQCEIVFWHIGIIQIAFKFFSWNNLALNSLCEIILKCYGLNTNSPDDSVLGLLYSLCQLFNIYCLMPDISTGDLQFQTIAELMTQV
jgi:hypothetical protein